MFSQVCSGDFQRLQDMWYRHTSFYRTSLILCFCFVSSNWRFVAVLHEAINGHHFSTAFTQFVSLCHILVTLTISQSFPLLYLLSLSLLSMNFDVIILIFGVPWPWTTPIYIRWWTFIQHSIGCPIYSNETRKMKGVQIRKEEVKWSLFVDDILYMEGLRDSTKKTVRTNYWIPWSQDTKWIYRNKTVPLIIASKEQNT